MDLLLASILRMQYPRHNDSNHAARLHNPMRHLDPEAYAGYAAILTGFPADYIITVIVARVRQPSNFLRRKPRELAPRQMLRLAAQTLR